MAGGRFNCNLLAVLVHLLDSLALGAGDLIWDVVDVGVRGRLKDEHRIELTITEHRFDGDVFFRALDQSPHSTKSRMTINQYLTTILR